jgi:hypothetical protein
MASFDADADLADLVHSLKAALESDGYRTVELAARAHYALRSRTVGAQVRAYAAAASPPAIDARA